MKERKKAAALKYDNIYEPPIVTASGTGYIAEKILEKAMEGNVPIIENKELTELLTKVEVGDSIPEEVYEAVATILAYIMSIDSTLE
ncbi:EscU/YscU/HrcU family type III secretion system export apparatus switch protein [Hathewaya histolytica]|uniref:Type III secretion exporter n=1 Tax=Hathewaya histolytica TaxID=1498 RepID=A0A4V6KC39_HATHI|nr:EscU/YscU/HrcU family type III secretion system export apparatus switch protein [Hathewaya histolytica]VTQ84907.1 type III secretion exporter [Hathewaya histolytica]